MPTFEPLRKATEELLDAFYQYKKYLDGHSVSVKAIQGLPLVELNSDKTSLITLFPSKEVLSVYTLLIDTLQNQPLYTVVFLQDYAPKDRFQRRQWLQKLKVPFNAMVYVYAHGNSFRSLNFIWRIGEEINHTQVNQAILYVSTKLPVFASRDVQQSFVQKYSHLSKAPKCVL